jgi:hypothetical protein
VQVLQSISRTCRVRRNKKAKKSLGQCRNCHSKEGQTDAPSTRRKKKNAAHKRVAVMTGDGTPLRSERTRVRERVEYRESSMECDTQSDSDEEKNSETDEEWCLQGGGAENR